MRLQSAGHVLILRPCVPTKTALPCEHDDLIAQVDRQQNVNARLQDRNACLTTTIKELRKQLAAAQRVGKRQAAPFSKGERTSKPRRPGRKPGKGNFSYRKPPAVDELTEPTIDVAVSEERCPYVEAYSNMRERALRT